MRIYSSIVDLILAKVKVEYSGTHCPHAETPLYGRRAYWRLYLPNGDYVCKVTAPVKSLNPKQTTLEKLLKAEIKKRLEAIQETCETDNYSQVVVYMTDPYGVRRLLEVVEGKYMDLEIRKLNQPIGVPA